MQLLDRLASTFVSKGLTLDGVRFLSEGQAVPGLAPVELSTEAERVLAIIRVTGLGYDERNRRVSVFLSRKPTRKMMLSLPERIEGIEVTYTASRNESINPERSTRPIEAHAGSQTKVVRCGDSISLGNQRAAGTLGALVEDKQGTLYGLTCNHVTGGCNNVPVGMPVVSPGILDVLPETLHLQMIGRHARVLPLRQGQPDVIGDAPNFDAALLSISSKKLVSSSQGKFYDTPVDVVDPETGMTVEKVGRTTGHTEGFIDNQSMQTFPYKYRIPLTQENTLVFQGVCCFKNGYMLSLASQQGSKFAMSGDSGALVVSRDAGKRAAVGLLIGDTQAGKGYMLPIRPILDALQVSLVSTRR